MGFEEPACDRARVTPLGIVQRGRRYELRQTDWVWLIDVHPTGTIMAATHFRNGHEIEGEPPDWIREFAREAAPGDSK